MTKQFRIGLVATFLLVLTACSSNPQVVETKIEIVKPPTGLLVRPVIMSWKEFISTKPNATNGDLVSYVEYLFTELKLYEVRLRLIEEFTHGKKD